MDSLRLEVPHGTTVVIAWPDGSETTVSAPTSGTPVFSLEYAPGSTVRKAARLSSRRAVCNCYLYTEGGGACPTCTRCGGRGFTL